MAHEGGVPVLEERILEWRSYVGRRRAIDAPDVDELEDHLRSQVADLQEAGLDEEEAFLIGVKRLGELDTLSREFAREHSERLWKRLVVADAEAGTLVGSREALVALGLAVAAALAIKVPELFGLRFEGSPAAESFYIRNVSLLVLPVLAGFFAWKRGLDSAGLLRLAAPFLAGALAMNLLPFEPGGSTMVLAALHLPMALWLAVGIGYAGGAWRNHDQRMNYVRFSGEWFIYYVLIALGGGVLMMFTMFIFSAIGLDAEWLLESWILPCGAAGAVIVAMLIGGGVFLLGGKKGSVSTSNAAPTKSASGVQATSKEISFPVKLFADGKARYFKYDAPSGIQVRYFIMKSSDGIIRAAFRTASSSAS